MVKWLNACNILFHNARSRIFALTFHFLSEAIFHDTSTIDFLQRWPSLKRSRRALSRVWQRVFIVKWRGFGQKWDDFHEVKRVKFGFCGYDGCKAKYEPLFRAHRVLDVGEKDLKFEENK